ncbi:MAG: RnfABCDGE type electron transport complex subunit G [Thermodesulfobacteriota bacterium]
MKNTSAKMIAVLTGTAFTVGAILAGFYIVAAPKIEANRLAEEKRAIFAVLPGAVDYETIEREITGDKGPEKLLIFRGLDGDGGTSGYAFVAKGPGFAAIITMMVGLNVSAETLSGMKVLEQLETPGLGNKIAEEKFEGQFRGLAIHPRIEYLKNKKPDKPNQIQAITGATISSKAVTEAINKRLAVVLAILEDELLEEEVIEEEPLTGEVPEEKMEEKTGEVAE